MNETLPTISVVMPVLNRVTMIERAIESVLNQQYSKVEFIILDGGSTDGTLDIINKHQTHLTYWHSKPDGGAATATNVGIQLAKGDLIVILMSDDWFEEGIFYKIADLYQNEKSDIYICGGRLVAFDQKNNLFEKKRFVSQRKQKLTFFNACFNPYFGICCYFVKPDVYQKLGLFQDYLNGNIFLANDREWAIRAAMFSTTSIVLPNLGYTYCEHDRSISFGDSPDTIIRHCHEHQWIVNHYLSTYHLSRYQILILLCWLNEQLAYLFYLHLFNKKYNNCIKLMHDRIKNTPLLWLVMFVFVTTRGLIRKCCRLIKKKLFGFR